jgi:hypothetical protein
MSDVVDWRKIEDFEGQEARLLNLYFLVFTPLASYEYGLISFGKR